MQSPDVTHLAPGTRVAVLKSDYGTWATQIVAPAWAVVPIPPNISEHIAAAAIEAYGTASYALEERGGLRAGERVLILGASGAVGVAAVEIAIHLDAEVIALTSDPTMWDDKPVKPHMILDRRQVNLRAVMKELFPEGVHVVLDPVGGDLAAPALRSLQPYGRYLVVGFASGRIPELPANQVLLRNRTVIGVEWATWITANHRYLARTLDVVLNRLARGVFHLPAPTLVPLDRLPRGTDRSTSCRRSHPHDCRSGLNSPEKSACCVEDAERNRPGGELFPSSGACGQCPRSQAVASRRSRALSLEEEFGPAHLPGHRRLQRN